jgi:hypothetical protein
VDSRDWVGLGGDGLNGGVEVAGSAELYCWKLTMLLGC